MFAGGLVVWNVVLHVCCFGHCMQIVVETTFLEIVPSVFPLIWSGRPHFVGHCLPSQ